MLRYTNIVPFDYLLLYDFRKFIGYSKIDDASNSPSGFNNLGCAQYSKA